MNGFKICSDGELLPQNLPCPPAYSGTPYSYPYDNMPLPPADSSSTEGGLSISPGAVAGIIVLVGFIFVLVCLFALKFGTRFTAGRNSASNGDMNSDTGGNRARAAAAGGDGGLEEKLVKLLPVSEYHHEESKPTMRANCRECAVCLSSFEEKEFIRVLPKCQHTFHLPCIDRWFASHASCPLCREKITLQTIELSATGGPDHPQQANECADHHGLESNENLNHVAVSIPDSPLPNQPDHRISTIAPPVADHGAADLHHHHQSKQESANHHHILSPAPPTSGAIALRKSFSTGSLLVKLDLHHMNCANNNYFFTKSQSLRAINIRLFLD